MPDKAPVSDESLTLRDHLAKNELKPFHTSIFLAWFRSKGITLDSKLSESDFNSMLKEVTTSRI